MWKKGNKRIKRTDLRLFLFLCFSAVSFSAWSQKENVIVSFPEIQMLFEGYSNRMTISFKEKAYRKFTVNCNLCDSIFKLKDGSYVVQPGSTEKVTIEVLNRKNQLVSSKTYSVFKLPEPIMSLDENKAFSKITTVPSRINLALSPEVPINMGFAIFNWTLIIDGKKIKGQGSEFSIEAKEAMLNKKEGIILIEIDYADVNERKLMIEGFVLNL